MHGHCYYTLKILYDLIIIYFLILFKILKYDSCNNSVSDCKLITYIKAQKDLLPLECIKNVVHKLNCKNCDVT